MGSGILTYALGHPQYARMALVMIATLKQALRGVDVPIAVACERDGACWKQLEPYAAGNFTLVECPHEVYTHPEKGVFDAFWAKVNMNLVTPWERTLFLDADLAFWEHAKVAEYLKAVEGLPFDCHRYGIAAVNPEVASDKHHWQANLVELAKYFGITDVRGYPDVNSSWFYFDRSALVCSMFEKARELFLRFPVSHKQFAKSVPDELPLGTALYFTQVPIQQPFGTHKDRGYGSTPYLIDPDYAHLNNRKLVDQSFALTMHGAVTANRISAIYNRRARIATKFMRWPVFQWVNKGKFDTKRLA